MTRLYSKTLGYYIPSFFEMHIDTSKNDLTINKLPLKDMTILFHEYIHFLQDFTTYYGLSAIYIHSEYLHSVVNRVYNDDSHQFIVPYKIADNRDNVLLNRRILNLTLGDCSELGVLNIKSVEEDSDELPHNPYFDKIPNIVIHTEDDCMVFGAMAIMESMAYILERCCSPTGHQTSPDFPYLAAEKVAEFYSPAFAADKLKVLALCDMSLQCSNPGHSFVKVMKWLASDRIRFDTPEAVYDYFYASKMRRPHSRETIGFLGAYKEKLMMVESKMKSYLQNMPMLESYYMWIEHLVAFAIDWRANDPYFLLKMARITDLKINGCWGKAIHDIGTPLMTNNNDNYYKIVPHDMSLNMDVEYFRAIREIENLFEVGTTSCSMYHWCIGSKDSTPNELCEKSPWLKSREKLLCPYALIWKHWNLVCKEPLITK